MDRCHEADAAVGEAAAEQPQSVRFRDCRTLGAVRDATALGYFEDHQVSRPHFGDTGDIERREAPFVDCHRVGTLFPSPAQPHPILAAHRLLKAPDVVEVSQGIEEAL